MNTFRLEFVAAQLVKHVADDPRTLAALARTCRPFRGPVSLILWEAIPSAAVLVHTLPGDAWIKATQRTGTFSANHVYVSRDCLSTTERARADRRPNHVTQYRPFFAL